jgi:LacI family transcriptional regulator
MATLADIARRAEVSPGTVSRVLNNRMNMPISQPTIERIRRAAEELGYRPNSLARALATGKTQTVGLYYRGTTETMFLRILEAVETKARERGYHLIVSSDRESFADGSRIDGLIHISARDTSPTSSPLGGKPVMYVTPSGENLDRDANTVTWSEFAAAHLAVQHLTALGHRHIGAIWGYYSDREPRSPRVLGFRAALAEAGATGAEEFEEAHPDPIRQGFLQMRRLLARSDAERITAVFARNDYMAMGALQVLHEAKIAVPTRMSLLHYGDSVLSRVAWPPLTSVSHPNAEASVLALEQLIAMIEDGRESFPTVVLPVTLRERGSCAAPPRE